MIWKTPVSAPNFTPKNTLTAASARGNSGLPTVEPWTLPYAAYNSWWQFEDRINEELLMREAVQFILTTQSKGLSQAIRPLKGELENG